ncbi:MAG: phosphotransferase [Armatimonadetes bacterium]|nr:phosphotransferase [Armatimonadota bacterium]
MSNLAQMFIRGGELVTRGWLERVLGEAVDSFTIAESASTWSSQIQIVARMSTGRTQKLRLKVCHGETWSSSEVDYYLRDYVDMENPPLVRCFDACFEVGKGYHLLLEDLSETFENRRERQCSMEYVLAVAEALGRMHRHQANSRPVISPQEWERYLGHIEPGLPRFERASGASFQPEFADLRRELMERWSNPVGQSLLHGDLNATNVLTPKDAEVPVYFLDRQPFDWSLTYGPAVYDLAYFSVIWLQPQLSAANIRAMLRTWFEAARLPDYQWDRAIEDWRLSVRHCQLVPVEWSSNADDVERMRWLWEWQWSQIQAMLRISSEV